MPAKVGERIEERTDQVLVVKVASKDQVEGEDDPYADYVIPDDLMW